MTFLKAQGIRGLVGKNDWPRFVEEEPEVRPSVSAMPTSQGQSCRCNRTASVSDNPGAISFCLNLEFHAKIAA